MVFLCWRIFVLTFRRLNEHNLTSKLFTPCDTMRPFMGCLPAKDALSLIYNKAIFDARGVDYPDETWTQQDLLEAAQSLTYQDVQGLALPVKSAYWWFGFQAGWGGSLFNETGRTFVEFQRLF